MPKGIMVEASPRVQCNIKLDVETDRQMREVIRFRPDRFPSISGFVQEAIHTQLEKERAQLKSQGVIR